MQKLFQKSATLRNWKEQVVGIERIKDDPFENDRRELEEYESVIRLVQSSVQRFHHSLSDVSRGHAEMMGALKRFHELNENIGQRKRIDAIDIAVDAIGDEFDRGKDQMDQVFRKLESLLAMHSGLGERLRERDKAHAAKLHYEQKVQELNAKESDKEKVDRNLKKLKEAHSEYEEREQVTVRECRDALNTKFKDMDQILGLYFKVIGEYYVNISEKFSKVVPLTEGMITSAVREEVSPSRAAPLVSLAEQQAEADEEHRNLRNALGLRVKPPAATARGVSDDDSESDLFTPPVPGNQ
jgi:hypothetical protein